MRTSHTEDRDQAIGGFLRDMARALCAYGTPAHRLEAALTECAERLGVSAQFFSTPTSVMVAIGEGPAQQTWLLRVEPGDVSLEKLVALDDTLARVMHGRLSPARGIARIRDVINAPPRYPPWAVVGSFGIVSAAASRFFAGGAREVAAAGLVGLIVGALTLLAGRHRESARLVEFLAGATVALLAGLAPWVVGAVEQTTIIIAGLIVLLPGLTLTLAMNELATKNLVAGSARLTGALTTFVSIGFGVAVGQRIASMIVEGSAPPTTPGAPLPGWTEALALLVAALPLTVLFRARPRDMLTVALSGVVAFYGARLGAAILGPELGVSIGALIVGVCANGYARLMNRPSAVVTLPGIMLLVPGGIGSRSVLSFLEHDALAGVQTAFGVALIAVSLVAGLLIANVLVRPRRAL